ncbi:proteophosphoglycan ppg4 [Rhodotorula toruloides]|uniref:Proteophosphoglycan ppg4 n=1 Tax=Rhodotorula toruloides TaxID=5286 RepID=A0A511KFM1_RHOTO|nr:proteophosphoglycan ppg4 [Rhodotorula toruloides]
MSKTYKFNEKLRPECRRDRDGYLQVQATPLAAPGFPLVLTFSGDPETKCYKLEWQTAGGPLMLFRRTIKVKDEHGATALETTLAGVYLREEYSGIDNCSSRARYRPHLPFKPAGLVGHRGIPVKKLLESDFSEGISQTSFDEALKAGTLPAADFDDSADENDGSAPLSAVEDPDNQQIIDELKDWRPNDIAAPLAPFKLVKITQSSHTTCAAALVWLASHYISFPRAAAMEAIQPPDAGLPSLASPKSVYRLAHLLGIDALASLALENLKSQLTPKNALCELYSDVACCYPAVRDVVLAYVLEHWSEVVETQAAGEMQDEAELGELPVGAAKTAMMLAVKLADRQK